MRSTPAPISRSAFVGFRFPPEVIVLAVRWYLRFRAPTYPRVLDELWPIAWHHVGRYANNRVEADHAQLKRWLRPMRGIKTMTGLRVLAASHAFVQNLHRGHYEIATHERDGRRFAVAFAQLAKVI
jgi:transposase-like protein